MLWLRECVFFSFFDNLEWEGRGFLEEGKGLVGVFRGVFFETFFFRGNELDLRKKGGFLGSLRYRFFLRVVVFFLDFVE